MSSFTRETSRSSREASFNGIVRRMVSLPRSIVGGFSRVMCHGRGHSGMAGSRDQNVVMCHGRGHSGMAGSRDENVSSNLSSSPPQFTMHPFNAPEEWAFITTFEQQYGSTHPFFYACRFMEALKIAEEEHKFMIMYLHSPQHPFTPSFCRETLCSEFTVQFLDANFVSWGALADRGEGLQMAATLQPATFPCCAVVAPAAGNSIAVLQQMEGPITPTELVEILQRTVEEHGSAFGNGIPKEATKLGARTKEEEAKIKADRELREDQDAAYLAALKIDMEKENLKNLPSERKPRKPVNGSTNANHEKLRQDAMQKQYGKAKEASATGETRYKDAAPQSKDPQTTQILIRFPNGERREQRFFITDKIQSIYRYIDSLGLQGIGNYRLISSFPRRVYGADQMVISLKDAGLHPKATLFLEQM